MIGCALSIVALALGCWVGFYAIANTELKDQYWLPFVYGGLCSLAYLNLWGILLAWQQRRAFAQPRASWKDGGMIGVTGIIRGKSAPMFAPFSKQQAVMVEYSVKFDNGIDNPSDPRICFGIMRTPCSIEFEGQSYRIQGSPLLAELTPTVLLPHQAFPAAMDFLSTNKFEIILDDPIKMGREVFAAFSDADGDIQTHYAMSDYKALFVEKLESQAGDNLKGLNPYRGFLLEERCIPDNSAVSINGTFMASENAIDIGGGLTKTAHSIKIGHAVSKSNGPIIKAVIFAAVFTTILAVATYFLLSIPKV
jgi:hypothetical protein